MAIKTHRVAKKQGRTEIFRNRNNPNEILFFWIRIIEALAFIVFIFFIGVVMYKSIDQPFVMLFLVGMVFLSGWLLLGNLRETIAAIKRNVKPILALEKSEVCILDANGVIVQKEVREIRSVIGRICSKVEVVERPKRIHFIEMFLELKSGEQLFLDVINSSKSYGSSDRDVIRELRRNAKEIGSFIANELNTQYHVDGRVNYVDDKNLFRQ